MTGERIILKTDASVDERGTGLAYVCEIYDQWGVFDERYTGQKFSENTVKSTDAELLAILFGMKELYNKMDRTKRYALIAKCDCNDVVKVVNKEYIPKSKKKERMIDFFTSKFEKFKAKWMNREENHDAHSMAKQALLEGARR